MGRCWSKLPQMTAHATRFRPVSAPLRRANAAESGVVSAHFGRTRPNLGQSRPMLGELRFRPMLGELREIDQCWASSTNSGGLDPCWACWANTVNSGASSTNLLGELGPCRRTRPMLGQGADPSWANSANAGAVSTELWRTWPILGQVDHLGVGPIWAKTRFVETTLNIYRL